MLKRRFLATLWGIAQIILNCSTAQTWFPGHSNASPSAPWRRHYVSVCVRVYELHIPMSVKTFSCIYNITCSADICIGKQKHIQTPNTTTLYTHALIWQLKVSTTSHTYHYLVLLSNPNAHQTWTFGWSALTLRGHGKSSRSHAAVSRSPASIYLNTTISM